MKNTSAKRLVSLVLALILILSLTLTMSSCVFPSNAPASNAKINEKGELIITYSDGGTQNLGVVSPNETTVNIQATEGDVSAATTAGLVSAVTVTANFEKTVNSGYGGLFPGYGGGSTTSEYSSKGSGVIYELDRDTGSAFIITNYHVVYDSSSNGDDGISSDIEVYLYGMEYEEYAIPAEYVGGSLYYDIAVLHVKNCDALKRSVYNSVKIADSDLTCAGDVAIAIGNPKGNGISASLGIVSVNSEYITMAAADNYTPVTFRVMRVDTAVNSGNSGGGLYNSQGELVGIVNAKIVDEAVENIAYAIPSSIAVAVAENIIDNCFGKENKTVMRALLGVTLSITDSYAEIDTESGALTIIERVSVSEILTDSPAEGKLQVGDVIKSITVAGNTTDVERRYHLIDEMLNARVGDAVTLTVERDGAEFTVEMQITEDCITAY